MSVGPDDPAFGEWCSRHGDEMQDHDCEGMTMGEVPAAAAAIMDAERQAGARVRQDAAFAAELDRRRQVVVLARDAVLEQLGDPGPIVAEGRGPYGPVWWTALHVVTAARDAATALPRNPPPT